MPQVPLQRWTDVALKREGGAEITKGAARLYGAVLVRETEGLLKLVLTRPARVTVLDRPFMDFRLRGAQTKAARGFEPRGRPVGAVCGLGGCEA